MTTSFIKFGKHYTFETLLTTMEASYLAIDCDSAEEFEAFLNAEEVTFSTDGGPNATNSYHQMSLL